MDRAFVRVVACLRERVAERLAGLQRAAVEETAGRAVDVVVLVDVTVCGTASSFVHVTVVPAFTSIFDGLKAESAIVTLTPPVEVSSPPLAAVGVSVGVAAAGDVAGDAAAGVLLLPPSAELVPPQAAAKVASAAIARTTSNGRMNHLVFMMFSPWADREVSCS